MKTIIAIIATMLFQLSGHGQDGSEKSKYLKVGDKLPDSISFDIINYHTKSIKFSEFKGKLLILDFWSTGCSSCIQAWPKMLGLQKEFGGKIQILLVNPWESEAVVKNLFKRRKELTSVDVTLPTICKNIKLLEYFNVSGVPHIVWVDEKGIIMSVTRGESVTAKNINAILEKQQIKMHQKIGNDDYIKPDFRKPLFVDGNGGYPGEIFWQSIVGKSPDSLYPGQGIVGRDGTYNAYCSQCSIKDLYMLAYSNMKGSFGDMFPLMMNRVRLEVRDTTKYVSIVNGETNYDRLFVYNLTSTVKIPLEKIQAKMQDDLKWHFGLGVKFEKRKVKCLVLTAADTAIISYKEGKRTLTINEFQVALNNVYLERVIRYLERSTNYFYSPYPIIDETGYKGKVGEIVFKLRSLYDHKEFDGALQKYKMRLLLEERDVDVLVLTDPQNYQLTEGE